MKRTKKADDIAVRRMELISPLLADGMDAAMLLQRKKEISEQTGISLRSIGRYLDSYRKSGFDGLKPKAKNSNNNKLPANWEKILEEAIMLRRELPARSVPQINNHS